MLLQHLSRVTIHVPKCLFEAIRAIRDQMIHGGTPESLGP
jgi:hypothetical protein